MAGGFKRSSVFGVVGLLVVMAAVAVIGLTLGSGQVDEPKPLYALIFGIVAVYFILLLALQRADLNRAAGSGARATQRAVAEGREIDNPTTMSEADLWAALAVGPIDNEAIRARGDAWGAARRSQSLAMVVVALIFLTVPPIYLLESFVPLLIGGPLIAIAAIYGAVRALMPGGELDKGYENVNRAMAPLGLEVTERPEVSIETRDAVTGRMGPNIRGALVLSGERHGLPVSVRLGGGEVSSQSEVTVGAASRRFEAKSRDGRIRPARDAPEEIVEALASVPNSTRWKKVTVEGGPEGIVVSRRGGEQSAWLCDLWLAERLAAV